MISTKIIATIGPASDDEKTIAKLYNAGMRVARLNFSHGNYEYFETVIARIRNVADDIAIIADTKGPEIRSGEVENNHVALSDRDVIEFTNNEVIGTNKIISIYYDHLYSLKKGDIVLFDDGLIETQIISNNQDTIKAKVLNGGVLQSHKTVTLKGHNMGVPFLSQKDKHDITFALNNSIDYIAASFVRTKEDVKTLRHYCRGHNIKILSKIEHSMALNNSDAIIEESDGIMIARGDLGVEINMEKIPKIQKQLIEQCSELGKPVIVATQMLESMKENPRPTRAEVSDVANAILQGTDGIMLSAETASGKYPLKAVEMMSAIAKEYEKLIDVQITNKHHSQEELEKNSISIYITKAAAESSKILNVAAIITPTESGFTPRNVSRFKPRVPIIAVVRNSMILRQLQLSWGVYPIYYSKQYNSVDDMVYELISMIYKNKLITKGDKVAITSGHTLLKSGHTNSLEIFNVKKVIDNFEKKNN